MSAVQDLAPYALYHSYWDQGTTPAHLPVIQSSWQQALPGGFDSDGSRRLAGFVGPSMCQQVFQSAATEDNSPMQATQRAQRHLAAGTSMRGSKSIPLPPVQGYEQVGVRTHVLKGCFAAHVTGIRLSSGRCFLSLSLLNVCKTSQMLFAMCCTGRCDRYVSSCLR